MNLNNLWILNLGYLCFNEARIQQSCKVMNIIIRVQLTFSNTYCLHYITVFFSGILFCFYLFLFNVNGMGKNVKNNYLLFMIRYIK